MSTPHGWHATIHTQILSNQDVIDQPTNQYLYYSWRLSVWELRFMAFVGLINLSIWERTSVEGEVVILIAEG